MKTFARKSVSLLLAVIMIVSLFTIIPISASAAVAYKIEFTYNNSTHTESNVASLSNLTYSMSTIAGWFNSNTNMGGAFRISTSNPNLSSSNSSVASISGSGSNGVVTIGGSTGSSTLRWRASNQNRTLTVTVSEDNHGYNTNNDPSAKSNLTYSGSAQALVNGGTATHTEGNFYNATTYSYRFSTSTSATSQPENSTYTAAASAVTGTNAGTYHVWWIWDTDASYAGAVAHGGFTVTIAKGAAEITTAPEAVTDLEYTGNEQELVTAGVSSFGKVLYALDRGEYSEDIPTATNAGDYVVSYKVEGTDNYNGVEAASIDVSIEKTDPEVTAPEANDLTYNGEEQELVTAGSAIEGTVLYSLDGGEYSEDIPTATNAGNYVVSYKVEGNDNFNDADPVDIPVEIKKATPVANIVVKDLYFNNDWQELIQSAELTIEGPDDDIVLSADEAKLWYSLEGGLNELDYSPVGKKVGAYDCYYRIESLSDNIEAVDYSVDPFATVNIYEAPTVTMTDYTFGDVLPEPAVEGNEGDGEVTYYYYPADGTEADAVEWTDMTATSVDVGEYKMYAEIAESDTAMGVTTEAVDFTVSNKTVEDPTITIDPEKNIYSGEEIEPAVTVKDGDDVIDPSEYEVAYAENVNAGTATITITDVEGGNYTVSGTLEFVIDKADIAPSVSIEGWTYGDEANEPEVTGNDGEGEVTYLYAKQSDLDALDEEAEDYEEQYEACWSEEVPTDADDYTVKAVIAETDNYNAGEATADFTIAQAEIAPEITIEGWTYGDEPNEPVLTGNTDDGEVTYLYKRAGDTDLAYTDEVPENADDYVVKAVIAATDNYKGGETLPVEFTIEKKDPEMGEDKDYNVTALTLTYNAEDQELVEQYIKEGSGLQIQYSFYEEGMNPQILGNIPHDTEIGEYPIYFQVIGNNNYNDVAWIAEPITAEIVKIVPDVTVDALDATYGDTLADVALPDEDDGAWAWDDEDTTPVGDAGEQTFSATYTPNDTDHYESVTQDVTINVAKADITPVITISGWKCGAYDEETNGPSIEEGGNPGEGEVTYLFANKDDIDALDKDADDYDEQYAACWSEDLPESIGDYLAKAVVAETDNYNDGESDPVEFTITQGEIINPEVVLEGWAYGDEPNEPSIAEGGNPGNAEVTYTYAYVGSEAFSATKPVLPGNYTVKAEIAETADYAAGTATADFIITKGTFEPTVTIEGWTYGDDANAPEVDNNVSEGEVKFTYAQKDSDAFSATVPTNAGDFVVKATVAATDLYESVEATAEFTIEKADIEPTVTIEGWTYGDEANVPEVTGNDGDGEVTFTYAVKGSEEFSEDVPTDVNEYTLKAVIAESDNYNGGEATADFAIAKADIAPVVTIEGWTYGDEANEPEVTGNDGEADVTITYAAKDSEEFSDEVPETAGDYTVKAVIAESDNYNGGEATADFTIAKADISPKVTLAGWTYGEDANEPEVTGNDGDGEVTFTYATTEDYILSIINPETEDVFSADVPTDANLYVVKATIAETDNYNGAEAIGNFQISRADIDLTVALEGWTYGDEANVPEVTGNDGEADVVITYAEKDSDDFSAKVPEAAGDYTVKATAATVKNYNGASVTADFTIAKADIAPTVTIEGWTYGDEANEPEVTGNDGEGDVTFTYAEFGSENFSETVPTIPGEYTVKAAIAESANYNGGEATADFTIAMASTLPIITIEGWTYGEEANEPVITDNESDGEVTILYAKQSDLDAVDKDADDYEEQYQACWSEEVPVDADDYVVSAKIAATETYNEAFCSAKFTISKAALTVTAKNQTVTYGSAVAQDKYTVDGLVDGDEITVKINSSIAQNIVKPVVTASDNYDVTVVTGILTIKGSPIANALPSGKNIVAKWSAVTNADGYDIYAGYCGSGDYPLIKSVKDQATTSFTITKLGGKAIDMKKNVFLYVVAYKNVNGKKVTLVRSASLHIAGTSTNYTNAKSVKVSASTLTLAKGKTSTIKPTVTLVDKTKTQPKCVSKLQYATSNSSVAKVDANGKITAVGKGTANVYVFAENGVKAKVAVTVQ